MTWTVKRVLGDRNGGLYLAAVVVSQFGSSSMWLAGGIWVKELTGSNSLAALCTFALWAPTLVGPLIGAVADRVRRRPLLVAANLGMALVLMSLFAVDSAARLWIVFTVLLLYGAFDVVADAAESALVASAVDKSLLGDFNGLRMSANEGMKLLAPLAGTGLLAAYGGPAVALLDAVTFVLAAGMYRMLRVREAAPVPARTGWRVRIAEGARYLWDHPALRPLVLAGGATMLLASLSSSMIYAVLDRIGRPPTFLAFLYVVQGVGSVVVGTVSGVLLRRLGERRFAAYGIGLTALAAAARTLPYEAVALVCSLATGLGLPCVLIAALTAVQRRAPDALLARATATANTVLFAPNAVGLGAGAGLVAAVDIRLVLPVVGALGLVTAVLLLRASPEEARDDAWTPR